MSYGGTDKLRINNFLVIVKSITPDLNFRMIDRKKTFIYTLILSNKYAFYFDGLEKYKNGSTKKLGMYEK